MKLFLFAIMTGFLWFLPGKRFSQTDSLVQLPSNVEGLRRIDLLNRLSEQQQSVSPEKAMLYAREAMRLAIDQNDNARLAVATINLGVVYRNIGQTNKALDAFMDALAVSEKTENRSVEADALHKIGVTYLLVNEYEDALEYGLREEKIWLSRNDSAGLATAYNFLGLVYLNLKRMNESYAVLIKSLEIGRARNDKNLMSKPLVNLGDLFLRSNEPAKALEFIEQSLAISRETKNLFGETVALQKMGTALGKLGRQKEAEKTLREALERAQQLRSLSLVRNTFRDLALLNEVSGGYKESLANYRAYVALEDSLFSEITKRKIAETVARYEIEKKEQENEQLRREAESRRRQFLVAVISAGLILMMSVVLFVLYRRQISSVSALRSLNEKVMSLNDEIETQKKALETQNAQLSEINLKKDRLFSIFAHDVRASFTGVLGFSEALVEDLNSMSKDEIKEMAERILRGTRAVNGLFENLLHWSRLELNEIHDSPTELRLLDLSKGLADIYNLHFSQKNLRFTVDIPSDLKLKADEYMLSTILRNLISNAIKFSHDNSEIKLSAEKEGNRVRINVADNGVGIPVSLQSNLFSLDSRISRPGTQNEKGTGLGLHVCKRLADKMGATLEVKSTEGSGTTIGILI